MMGTQLAKQLGIPIHSIKFRHSTAKYSCDETGIYKGIESVKFLNETAADDLYSIREESFDSFIDLLARIGDLKVDSRKLDILIKLNFFEEFGDIVYLLKCNEYFSEYYSKKQIKKDKALESGLDFELIRSCCSKETPKTFMELDGAKLVKILSDKYRTYRTTTKQKIAYQMENLGYVDIVDKKYAGYCYVTDLDTKYSPKLKLYAMANGNTIPVKIAKKLFENNPIRIGDIIKVKNQAKQNKKVMVNGKWTDTDEKEWWVTDYDICNSIQV
jgi:DNA polymerase III alpha subunit